MSNGRLTEGFREIIEYKWSEFVELEQSVDATNYDSIITAIARAANKGSLRAIQSALDRLDGKIATELDIEYPKFYTLYPNATKTADDPSIIDINDSKNFKKLSLPVALQNDIVVQGAPADIEELHAQEEEELPTGSLRKTLERMLDSPKSIVKNILDTAAAVDKGDLSYGDPKVKSVIVAGLMKLVHEGRISAVFEVFDQIDGKVAEKVKVLGQDVYMKNYSVIAPAGAVKNEDGIYQIMAENVTDQWTARLEVGRGNR